MDAPSSTMTISGREVRRVALPLAVLISLFLLIL
jgi:hypothetical protein